MQSNILMSNDYNYYNSPKIKKKCRYVYDIYLPNSMLSILFNVYNMSFLAYY